MNRLATEALRRRTAERLEQAQGRIPNVLRLSGARSAEVSIPDVGRLPVEADATELQNGAGAFLWLTDWSIFGGGDVLG